MNRVVFEPIYGERSVTANCKRFAREVGPRDSDQGFDLSHFLFGVGAKKTGWAVWVWTFII